MQKLGIENVTVEQRGDPEARSALRDADVAVADDFFRLLGWTTGATADLLDRLLRCVGGGEGDREGGWDWTVSQHAVAAGEPMIPTLPAGVLGCC